MTQLPIPQSPFEPVRSYDIPELLISQVIDRELSFGSFRDTLFSPENLSTKQRETYVTRLKEKFGRSPLSDAFVDLATNPFVWLTFLTAPIGGAALRAGGRTVFEPAAKYSAWVLDHAPFLKAVLTGTQAYVGTPIYTALTQVSKDIGELGDQFAKRVNPHLDELRKSLDLKTLDIERVADKGKRAQLQEIDDTMGAWLRGFDQDTVEIVPTLKKRKGKKLSAAEGGGTADPTFEFSLREVKRKRLVTANLDAELDRLGIRGLAEAYRDAMNDRWVRLFGDESLWKASRTFTVDDDKVLRLWRGVRHNKVTRGSIAIDNDQGAGVIASLMGPEMAEAVREGVLSSKEFLSMVRQTAEAPIKNAAGQGRGFYFPRNMPDLVGAAGLTARDLNAVRAARSFITSTGQVISRRSSQPLWHQLEDGTGDIQRYRDRFGATEALDELIEKQGRTINAQRKKIGGAEGVYVQRLNTFQGLKRYFKDTAETVALYGRTLDDAPRVRVKRQESLDILGKPFEGTGRRAEAVREGQEGALRRIQVLRAEEQRFIDAGQWGGRSIADVLAEGYAGLGTNLKGTTTYLQSKLRDVFIPMVTGRSRGMQETALFAATIDGKDAIRAFLDSGVGQAMKKSSNKFTKGLFDRMDGLADYDVPLGAGQTASRGLAKWLYVTHLGVNLASVTLNMMQPMLLAATWMGPKAVIKGYMRGFEELGGYLTERIAKHGLKTLDDITHRDLINKHFKHAELMHIGRDAFETMDSISFPPTRIGTQAHKESVLFDYPMKLFEKAEWLNRSITAHAMEEVHRVAGRNLKRGTDDFFRMQNDVEEMVMASQFGSGPLNTPGIFMQGLFSNPLARQFFAFPLRSFTGLFYQSGRVGGRVNRGRGIAEDFLKGMGISAIVYETGKGLFGADMSRGLFLSATTDVIGGERFFEDGNEFIPVPPVIDIPVDLARGLMKNDADLMKLSIARLIPGGVALSRLLNVAPDGRSVLAGLPGLFQKTYVDWTRTTPQGLHPVYKGDGTLLDFRSGSALIMKGLGADLQRFQAESEIDGFLVNQRDQIVEARREAMTAYLSNNVGKGNRIRDAFQKKFGFPLTITQRQMKQAIRLRQVPRTERILDNLPTQSRPIYQALVANTGPERLGLTDEQITEFATSRAREQFRPEAGKIDPERIKELQRIVNEQQERENLTKGSSGFLKFEGF